MPHEIVSFDEEAIKGYVGKLVLSTVQETINALLDEEADQLVNAGRYEAYNVVPPELTMSGTVRTYSAEVRERIEAFIRQMADDAARTCGCTAEVKILFQAPPSSTTLSSRARGRGSRLSSSAKGTPWRSGPS